MGSVKDLRRARRLFRSFRESEPRHGVRVRISAPKALMFMGYVQLIAYTTKHGNKIVPYQHEFAPGSRPILAAGSKRGQLYLLGKGFRVTAHGIVDVDPSGRRRQYRPRLKVVRKT